MIDIHKLMIVNYCHMGCTPLKNIVRLPKAEAFALADELAQQNKGKTAFGRFADFENYYSLRMRQDEYLYKTFSLMGGKLKVEHPLSFVLQGSEYLDNWFDKGMITTIRLDDIPSEYISFTYGDSGAVYNRTGEIAILTKEDLLKTIREYQGTIDAFMDEVVKQHYYIEAQLWNDDFCSV